MSSQLTGEHGQALNQDQILREYGIASSFADYSGQQVEIPLATRLKILQLMGFDFKAATDAATNDSLAQQQAAQARWLDRASVLEENSESVIELAFTPQESEFDISWKLLSGDEVIAAGAFRPGQLSNSAESSPDKDALSVALKIPALAAGYYQLELDARQMHQASTLIVCPAHAYSPAWIDAGERLAGLSIQLYTLVSDRNWGMGDFTDLKELIRDLAAYSIDFLVLNPLHILNTDYPDDCSPYNPMDRRFLHPLYIDLECEEDFLAATALQKRLQKPSVEKLMAEARAGQWIDYKKVTKLKFDFLSGMYRYFKKEHLARHTERAQRFHDYLLAKGLALENFALFQAEKNRFRFAAARDPQFHCYLQWLAECQLEQCQQLATEQGMKVGLVRDLAVGSNAGSIEVKANPELFCTGASIGAPPDPLAPQGQNWGLPPINPMTLRESGFAHFIDLLQANASHCGALRIDHVMALMRLWWCVGSENDGEGAYVFYPMRELFAILRLESHLQQSLIIGEDLGVVPPEIRHEMSSTGIFSNTLFYFEKYDAVHFRKPHDFKPKSLAMIANHDVPTLRAWWDRSDLRTRREIGLIASEEAYQQALGSRESDLIQILHGLNECGLLPGSWNEFNSHKPFDVDLCAAILRMNARSSAQLVSVQLDDLCLTELPVNIPGTHSEYKNWRRRMLKSTRLIFDDPECAGLLKSFAEERVP